MAEYNISKLVLPSGDICKIVDTTSGWVRDVKINNTSAVVNQVANIPLADASTVGVVSTSAQTFAGTKTFTSSPRIKNGTQYTTLHFLPSDAVTDDYYGLVGLDTGSASIPNTTRMYFGERSINSSTGAVTSYAENYWLPASTNDLSETKNYNIFTTKDFNSLNFKENGVLLSNENIDTDLEYGITYYTQNSAGTQALGGTKPPISSGMKIIQYNNYYSTASYDIQFATSSTAVWMRFKTSASVWGDWGRINSTTSVIPIEQGGTNATTASQALINLGAQATITGAATTVTSDNLTASRVLISNSSGKIAVSSSVTTTELGYLDGVTSAIQTQLDNKKPKQTAVSDPTYSGTSLTFINSISQDANGVITPTKTAITAASSTSNGIVTIDNQTFAGRKTINLINPTIYDGTGNSSRYRYIYFNNNSDNHVAYIRYDSGNATNITSGQFVFGEYSPKETPDTDSTGYTNYFYLPVVDTGVTSSSKGYKILTSKEVVAVSEGGTGETTLLNAINSLLSSTPNDWTATPTDNTYFVRQDTGGSDSFGRVKFSTLWTYIKGKGDSTYKTIQTAVSNPTASGDMVDTFVYSITQDTNGVISPVRRQVQAASDSQRGVVTTSSQSFAGQKTFISNPIIGAADATGGRLYLRDRNSAVFPAVCYNGNNFWLGKTEAASASYVGQTYINTGYNGSAGYPTIKVNVPNDANNGGTTYEVYHTGYKPSPADIGAKAVQTAVSDPTASGSGIEYIATISQNAQGVITATKSTVRSASDSQSGVVTTGSQTFAGIKTLKANYMVLRTSGNTVWPRIALGSFAYTGSGSSTNYSNIDEEEWCAIYGQTGGKNVTNNTFFKPRIFFRSYSADGAGNKGSHYETYYLPLTDNNRTTDGAFNILTSKDTVTVAQGGTGKTDATEAMQSFIEALGEGTGVMSSGDAYMITGHASTPTTTTTFYRRKASNVRVGGLLTGRTLKVSLGSTSASTAFDGTANISDIGVSGTLAIGNGGTGATSASAARTALGVKATQTAVSSPSATEAAAYSFIDTVSQDTQGVITPTKKYLGTLSFSSQGIHLESGTNIDTGLTVGLTYYTVNSTETQALTGTLPITGSGMKIITFYGYSGSNYHRQFALGSGDAVYMRTRSGSSTWRDWKTFSLSDHTHTGYLGAISANGYYGMATPDGTDSVWIRTTTKGIIPYESGGAGSGHGGLGTTGWRFATAYIDDIYGTLNGDCTGNAVTATTASKLGSATVGGAATAPIYLNAGTATAMTDISLVRTTTTSTSINAGNSNGSVKLYASTNRGLYDTTRSSWIIYYHVADDNVYVTKWKDIGKAYRPVYFDSNGAPVACNATTSLFSGSFVSTSSAATLTNGYANYNYLIFLGTPNSGNPKASLVVPTALLTTSDQTFSLGNEGAGVSIKLKRSGTNNANVTMTWNAGSGGLNAITNVYGAI